MKTSYIKTCLLSLACTLAIPAWADRVKDLVEQFDTKPAEIKALFINSLDATRAAELRSQFLVAGLPI